MREERNIEVSLMFKEAYDDLKDTTFFDNSLRVVECADIVVEALSDNEIIKNMALWNLFGSPTGLYNILGFSGYVGEQYDKYQTIDCYVTPKPKDIEKVLAVIGLQFRPDTFDKHAHTSEQKPYVDQGLMPYVDHYDFGVSPLGIASPWDADTPEAVKVRDTVFTLKKISEGKYVLLVDDYAFSDYILNNGRAAFFSLLLKAESVDDVMHSHNLKYYFTNHLMNDSPLEPYHSLELSSLRD
jgi:hypothetical protein